MPSEDAETPSEELDAILSSAREKGVRIANLGRQVSAAGQEMADIAEATQGVVHIVPHPPSVEFAIETWRLASSQADALLARLDTDATYAFVGTSGSAAVYSTDFADRPSLYAVTPLEARPLLSSAITNLENVLERSVHLGELDGLMRSFGLHQAPTCRKSPLELILTAHNAFQTPVNEGDPVSTSLIPLRESLNASIEHLMRHRPKQEKARSEWAKIVSLGTQLKRHSTPPQLVNTWAAQWTNLLDKALSPAKQDAIPREEWRNRLLQGTLFLKSLLSGLDPSRLRGR